MTDRDTSNDAAVRRYQRGGIALIAGGTLLAVLGAIAVHLTEMPLKNEFGQEVLSGIPRDWYVTLLAQIVSLTGVLILMAGIALAYLYERPMTWARATIGAFLFTGLMMILFGVIPNEYLTLTQSTLDWSGLRQWVTLPRFLTLGNEVSLSAAAVKDIIGQGYILTVTVGIVVAMWKWQERQKTLAEQGPPVEVSKYGRPITKVER